MESSILSNSIFVRTYDNDIVSVIDLLPETLLSKYPLPEHDGYHLSWLDKSVDDTMLFFNSYQIYNKIFFVGYLHFMLVIEKKMPAENWYSEFDIMFYGDVLKPINLEKYLSEI